MNLPEEICHNILLFLGSEASDGTHELHRPAHYAAALVCKQFNWLTTPLMYKSLCIGQIDERLFLLLRTFAECTHLAQMVREVEVSAWNVEEVDQEPRSPVETLSMLAAIDRMNLPESARQTGLRIGVKATHEDALVSLFFLLCRNLTSCKFEIPHQFDESLMGMVLDPALVKSTNAGDAINLPLHRVTSLSVEHWDTEGACVMDLSPWFRLPAIARFRSFAFDFTDPDLHHADLTSPTNLKHIHIQHSLIDDSALTWILESCPLLENLEIEWGSSTVGESDIDRYAIGVALNDRGQSLRQLGLDASQAFELEEENHSTLSSMVDMTSLRSLTVGSEFLLHDDSDPAMDSDQESIDSNDSPAISWTDLLPRSLRFLRITRCDADLSDELETRVSELLQDKTFARLRTIALNCGGPILQDNLPPGWTVKRHGNYWIRVERSL
nr:hypothetical protein CFP56_43722 [Quercus suber]